MPLPDREKIKGNTWQGLPDLPNGVTPSKLEIIQGFSVAPGKTAGPFNKEQKDWLEGSYIDVTGRESEITAISQAKSGPIAQSVKTVDNRWVLPASLLTDPTHYGGDKGYYGIIHSCPFITLTLSDFPTT